MTINIVSQVRKLSKHENNFDTEEESERVPDLEHVQVRTGNSRLTCFASWLLNPKEEPKKYLGQDRVEKVVESVVQEELR